MPDKPLTFSSTITCCHCGATNKEAMPFYRDRDETFLLRELVVEHINNPHV